MHLWLLTNGENWLTFTENRCDLAVQRSNLAFPVLFFYVRFSIPSLFLSAWVIHFCFLEGNLHDRSITGNRGNSITATGIPEGSQTVDIFFWGHKIVRDLLSICTILDIFIAHSFFLDLSENILGNLWKKAMSTKLIRFHRATKS